MAGRFRNQVDILDIDAYDYLKIAIVGAGSIGSFLALALNKLGFKNLIIIDDDKVEDHNVATQYYHARDKGQHKVQALRRELEENVAVHATKVKATHKIKADVVFVCVDSLKQRKIILKSILDSRDKYNSKPSLIIDGRMHRLLFRVYTIPLNNAELVKKYTKSLMGTEFKGKCTEKGIIQNAFAIVSTMVEQLKKVVNGEKYHAILNCDFENFMFNKQVPMND
jgi:molybdopterin/thiamine biosynthesis adenylyltransferase